MYRRVDLLVLVLLGMLLMAGPALPNDLSATMTDAPTAADSLDERTSTTYTDWMRLPNWVSIIQYAIEMREDTAWGDDTTFIFLETSYDKVTIASTVTVDTLLATGTTVSPVITAASATVFGPYVRGKFVHWDSLGAGEADSALVNGASYDTEYELWLMLHP